MIVGVLVWLIVRVVRNRRLDWVLLIVLLIVGGNIAVTLIAAPYEPERLCVTSLPVMIVGFVYAFEVLSRRGSGKRIESAI